MTREEEVRNAIDTIIPIFRSNNGRTYEQALMASGFEAGVKWADTHPKSTWISVEDDLPCNHEELIHFVFTNNVLVIDDQQNTFIAFMKKYKDNEWIWDSTNNFVFLPFITHWMPIPKLPKEQEIKL